MRISLFENQTGYLKKVRMYTSPVRLLVCSMFPEASWPNLSLGIFGLHRCVDHLARKHRRSQEIRIPRLLEANKSLQTMEFTFEKEMKKQERIHLHCLRFMEYSHGPSGQVMLQPRPKKPIVIHAARSND